MEKDLEKLENLMAEHRSVCRRHDVLLKFMLALAPKYRTDMYEANISALVEDAEILADEYLANAQFDLSVVREDLQDAFKEAH